ncbi:MAG: aldehyde dehydrogenase family protein, partial [Bdellovibrionales bacterium]|nr:aldehyde dehydrogenase family protein [Bdellovibrionales bacterium]
MIEIPTKKDCLNFIKNEWIKGTGKMSPVYSPYNGEVIGEYYHSNTDDINKACEAAKAAFPTWSTTPIKERTRIMFNFRDILLRDLDKITHIKCSESGKTFSEGKAGLLKGIEVLEFALSLQNLDTAGKMEVSRGVSCEYRRKPLGVVGSITPFNFPAMVPMWTIPIALTVGNCYIWKPSEKTPLTSLAIADALKEAGLPEGVFSVVQGDRECAEALIDHPEIKAIAFVGSTAVAKAVYTRGTAHGKRVLALGGAKNHIVLLPDANPELSGVGISNSFTGCAGQRCMAASVLLAVGDVDQHINEIKKTVSSQTLGESMGAIITKEQKEFLESAIERAVADGATLLLDGRNATAPKGMENGYWLGPTILDNVKPNSEAHLKELFGPVLSIIRCQNIAGAMEIENSVKYGNACSVFTSNGGLADKVINQASAGRVG